MVNRRLTGAALLAAFACGLVQGCTATAPRTSAKADGVSISGSVLTAMYAEERYVTGSRIAHTIDRRVSVNVQSSTPIVIVTPPRLTGR